MGPPTPERDDWASVPEPYASVVKTVVIGVLAVMWVAALLGLSAWVWLRARRAGLDAKRAAERRRALRDRQRPERDLERAVREATSTGAVVVVARRGSNPTRVTWSDGSVWFFFEDRDRYVDAKAKGMAPVGASYVGEPPAMGTQRTSTSRPQPGQPSQP